LTTPDINFRNIRKHRRSQNDGFEELTRQLVLAEPLENYSSIENRGPGADGGVEILVKFPDDRVWGWQSKYFPDSFGASEVAQLKKSFSEKDSDAQRFLQPCYRFTLRPPSTAMIWPVM
jgi:hypothetical protein